MILGTDGDEQVTMRIDRFTYKQYRAAVWDLKRGKDIILATGVKPGYRTAREILVKSFRVIDMEEDE